MIQEYLTALFIKTTEDANFDKLKKAANEIVKRISKDKAKIVSYTITALDPEIPADNPEISEVQKIIIEYWPTFIASEKDTPLTTIRAVILEALQSISEKEQNSASLIWFAGRNIIKYYKLGHEREILTNFLIALGDKTEGAVSESWCFNPESEIDVPEFPVAKVDKAELEAHLKAAALSTAQGGENSNQPAQNEVNWPTFLATRASKGIAETLNKTLKNQANEIKNGLKEFVYQNSLHQMRTQLLWWKEAGYSPMSKKGYKELKNGELQVILAYDYSYFVPALYPTSIDYFFKEAHSGLSESNDKKKISEILKLVEENTGLLKGIISEDFETTGRISLLDFVKGLVFEKFQSINFQNLVGIDNSTELTLAEFSGWLFHDLQSQKLLSLTSK